MAESVRNISSWRAADAQHLQANCGQQLERRDGSFSFPHPSGGEELSGAPLVYIPDLVQKVVDLLEENERLIRRSMHKPCKLIFNPMQDRTAYLA